VDGDGWAVTGVGGGGCRCWVLLLVERAVIRSRVLLRVKRTTLVSSCMFRGVKRASGATGWGGLLTGSWVGTARMGGDSGTGARQPR
jgi:hypothetical protein